MTRTLILMRHAKSSWNKAGPDHDRPLNDRGRRSAAALGEWLHRKHYLPDEALVSSAARTMETWQRLDLDTVLRVEPQLYHADAELMLRVLRKADGKTVLVLGHNPGIADFAHLLLARPPEHPRFDAFPTCATLVCRLPATWSDAAFGCAEPLDFTVPRDLGVE
ncbi:histidine phosphatase family protein [Aquicoccus sp. SCR17]|nr:histidine phosphatase family protein [Carideicomes alvinocaridis]